MQEAASATLITKAGPAKSAGRHGAQTPAKSSFQAILGAKAQAGKKADLKDADLKAALLKAISRNKAASTKDHAPAPAEATEKKPAVGLAHQLAQAAATGQPAQQKHDANKAVPEAAEHPADNQKKKTAKASAHADGAVLINPMMTALLGVKGPGISGQKQGEQGKAPAENVPSIHQASSAPTHKTNELQIHVVDARKKHADVRTEDANTAVKPAKDIVAEKDSAPVIITKDSSVPEPAAREAKGQNPVPQAPTSAAIERLREMAGSELTRAAGIILRDGGGELKLTLKPESLGSVRIRMNLVDNAIEGRIIVDNTAVKHVFENSLSSLMRALTAEGFQTASLQVSVGGQGSDSGRQDRDQAPKTRRVESVQGAAGSGASWNVPAVENLTMGDLLVNLFV